MKKTIILSITLLMSIISIAQTVKGSLTLNGKTKAELALETNSAVQLFKEFKTGNYQLGFNFESNNIKPNIYKETIVFFDFITRVERNGKLIKEILRSKPIPYFPGEMLIGAETFDFIGILASIEKENDPNYVGVMPAGEYKITLAAAPTGFKGAIDPLEFYFALRKRPTR